jgi:hypothetical protein
MRDVVFLLLAVGFFALAAAYVRGCAAMVGPDVTEASLAPTPRAPTSRESRRECR